MEKKSDYLVIIPAYNEAETIEELVLRVKKYADVCVINDNSNDETPEILERLEDIHVIHHEKILTYPVVFWTVCVMQFPKDIAMV